MTTTRHKPRQPRTFARLLINYDTPGSRIPDRVIHGHIVPSRLTGRESLAAGSVLETISGGDATLSLASPEGAEVCFTAREVEIATPETADALAWACFDDQLSEIFALYAEGDPETQQRIARQILAARGDDRNFGDMTIREVCTAIRDARAHCIIV